MLLSDIISKPIISLNEGQIKGTILSATFSNFLSKLLSFQVVSLDENEEDFFLEKEYIKCIGDDAIILKQNYIFNTNNSSVIASPINGLAYSTTGKLLGKIINVEIDDKFNVINIITNAHTLNIDTLVSFSNNLYIFNLVDKKVKKYSNKFIFPKVQQSIKVSSLPLISENNEVNTPASLPTRTITNSEVLLGKRVTKTIQTQNGEIIAKKGYIISQKMLTAAAKNQKLRELAIYSE